MNPSLVRQLIAEKESRAVRYKEVSQLLVAKIHRAIDIDNILINGTAGASKIYFNIPYERDSISKDTPHIKRWAQENGWKVEIFYDLVSFQEA